MDTMAEDSPQVDNPAGAGAMRLLSRVQRPVEVGDVELDDCGQLRPRSADGPVCFTFVYRGITFHAEVSRAPGAPLTLSAVIGVVPYSAESTLARRMTHCTLAAARLARGALRVDENLRVHLEMSDVPPRPLTPVTVIATVVALMMDARPVLDLLEVTLRRPHRVLAGG